MAWLGLLVLVVQYIGKFSLPEGGFTHVEPDDSACTAVLDMIQ